MRVEVIVLIGLTFVFCLLTSTNAEYVWNGSEWVWQAKTVSRTSFYIVPNTASFGRFSLSCLFDLVRKSKSPLNRYAI